MRILSTLALAVALGFASASFAAAQPTTPPAPPASGPTKPLTASPTKKTKKPAAKKTATVAKPRTAESIACSEEATAKGLKGKPRTSFMNKCKKQSAKKKVA